jgi:hypothetical protein
MSSHGVSAEPGSTPATDDAPTPDPPTDPAIDDSGDEGKPAPISRKDMLSLIISSIALLVSGSSLIYTISKDKHANAADTKYQKAQAYNLGFHITVGYVLFTQTSKGDPAKIDAARKSARLYVQNRTGDLMAALKLTGNATDYLVAPDPNATFGNTPFESLYQRINSVAGEEAAAAFMVSHGLTYISLEAAFARVLGTDNLRAYHDEIYPLYQKTTNDNLARLGITEQLPQFSTMDDVVKRADTLRQRLDTEIGGNIKPLTPDL